MLNTHCYTTRTFLSTSRSAGSAHLSLPVDAFSGRQDTSNSVLDVGAEVCQLAQEVAPPFDRVVVVAAAVVVVRDVVDEVLTSRPVQTSLDRREVNPLKKGFVKATV